MAFVVKIPIDKYKVAKALIDNSVALNLTMRHTYIEMIVPLSAFNSSMSPSTT
jgi:hypothetical protein